MRGAPGDNTHLLRDLIEQSGRVDGIVVTHLPSPKAVAELSACSVGDDVVVAVGGEYDRMFCKPLEVLGQLVALEQGPIADDGQFGTEPFVQTGRIACIAIENVRLVLTERVIMGPQPSLFRKVGIDPYKVKIVALKTGVGYKATYGHVVESVFRSDCPGACSYDLSRFDYKLVPRPACSVG